jgi:hypothetical protein
MAAWRFAELSVHDGGTMFDQLFDTFRKASESSLKAQQDMFKQWMQQWPAMTPNIAGTPGAWNEAVQARFLDSTTEALNKHREMIDSMYKSGIKLIEQSFHLTDAKSPEDYRRMLEELWRKLSDSFKEQSESQFREFQKAAEKWAEVPVAAKAKT